VEPLSSLLKREQPAQVLVQPAQVLVQPAEAGRVLGTDTLGA
jgi:hypothetical protein